GGGRGGWAWARGFARVGMAGPAATAVGADRWRGSCSRHFGSSPASPAARRHHAVIRSGFTGRSPTARIHGPHGSRSERSNANIESVAGSTVTVLRLPVFVGSSRSTGFVFVARSPDP